MVSPPAQLTPPPYCTVNVPGTDAGPACQSNAQINMCLDATAAISVVVAVDDDRASDRLFLVICVPVVLLTPLQPPPDVLAGNRRCDGIPSDVVIADPPTLPMLMEHAAAAHDTGSATPPVTPCTAIADVAVVPAAVDGTGAGVVTGNGNGETILTGTAEAAEIGTVVDCTTGNGSGEITDTAPPPDDPADASEHVSEPWIVPLVNAVAVRRTNVRACGATDPPNEDPTVGEAITPLAPMPVTVTGVCVPAIGASAAPWTVRLGPTPTLVNVTVQVFCPLSGIHVVLCAAAVSAKIWLTIGIGTPCAAI